GDAHQRLMDLLLRQTHGVIIGTMRGAFRALSDMPARQLGFAGRPGIHACHWALTPKRSDRKTPSAISPRRRQTRAQDRLLAVWAVPSGGKSATTAACSISESFMSESRHRISPRHYFDEML